MPSFMFDLSDPTYARGYEDGLRERDRRYGSGVNGGVLQEWILDLPMQQQAVLVLACRGPDGCSKKHEVKDVILRYRASVLKSAHWGRALRLGEHAPTFMTLLGFGIDRAWESLVTSFFDHADSVPHHYYMHLMHGAEIAGYKHPDELFRSRWSRFYQRCCDDLHLGAESEVEMDARLSDWNREFWY